MPRKTKVTLKDMADYSRGELSLSTVSRVYNDPSSVKPETRQKVLEIARRLGYQAPKRASNLAFDIVALYMPERYITHSLHYYSSGVLNSVFRAFSEEALLLSLIDQRYLYQDKQNNMINTDAIERLGAMLQGLIFLRDAPQLSEAEKKLVELGLPTVFLGAVDLTGIENKRIGTLDLDNSDGVRQAFQYLKGLGHERIAYIAGPKKSVAANERRRAYEVAYYEFLGQSHPAGYIQESAPDEGWSERSGYRGMRELLKLSNWPTAVLAGNDTIAYGALKALEDEENSPQISVIGHDHFGGPGVETISTIDHRIGSYGTEALSLLRRLWAGEIDLPPLILKPMLVEGNTCFPSKP